VSSEGFYAHEKCCPERKGIHKTTLFTLGEGGIGIGGEAPERGGGACEE